MAMLFELKQQREAALAKNEAIIFAAEQTKRRVVFDDQHRARRSHGARW